MTWNTHAHSRSDLVRRTAWGVALALALVPTAACSAIGGADSAPDSKRVVLISHESFDLPQKVTDAFTEKTGYELVVRAAGDAGTVATKLALTADRPSGDLAFGIDNTFASRPLDAGAFAPYDGSRAPGSEAYDLAEGSDELVPVDVSHVCVNVDTAWFEAQKQKPPVTLDDLTKPAYRDLMVTPAPSTSSPGMAFLLATVAANGEQWPSYWKKLLGNGAKVVDGWSDAYYTDFTAASEKGTRPIVVSYDSSPAFTLSKDKKSSTTAALLDTCFRQVEYAGVLAGAKNPEGAQAAVEFLTSDAVQAALPESMYVFPVSDAVELPDDWAAFAVQPTEPFEVDATTIAATRDAWLTQWTDLASR